MKTFSSSLAFFTTLSLVAVASVFAAPHEIMGSIKIATSLKGKIGPDAVLYVIARPEGESNGPPAAVKRITQPFRFPLHFTISSQDSMMGGGGNLEGRFTLTARVSQSGSATPASAGDLQAKTPVTATAGGKPVAIKIDEVRK